jgi:hypothetical protein
MSLLADAGVVAIPMTGELVASMPSCISQFESGNASTRGRYARANVRVRGKIAQQAERLSTIRWPKCPS